MSMKIINFITSVRDSDWNNVSTDEFAQAPTRTPFFHNAFCGAWVSSASTWLSGLTKMSATQQKLLVDANSCEISSRTCFLEITVWSFGLSLRRSNRSSRTESHRVFRLERNLSISVRCENPVVFASMESPLILCSWKHGFVWCSDYPPPSCSCYGEIAGSAMLALLGTLSSIWCNWICCAKSNVGRWCFWGVGASPFLSWWHVWMPRCRKVVCMVLSCSNNGWNRTGAMIAVHVSRK